jgi:hypothetical protein
MNVHDLASSPIFIASVGLCALVAAYSITVALRSVFQRISSLAAFSGLSKAEIVGLDTAAKFHERLRILIEIILKIESFSNEAPGVFVDNSWARLLRLCDDLEVARGELNALLSAKKFDAAAQLGRFLCGFDVAIPSFERQPGGVELRSLTFWQRDTGQLLHRMISRLEDEGRGHDSDLNPFSRFSDGFQDAIEEAANYIEEAGLIE